MITVSLADKSGNIYTEEREDYITNNKSDAERKIFLDSYVTELKERQSRLTFADGIDFLCLLTHRDLDHLIFTLGLHFVFVLTVIHHAKHHKHNTKEKGQKFRRC